MARVVVADDDVAILDATTVALELGGHQVKSCCRGEFLTEVEYWQPDIYLLDVRMSGCDGLEMAHQLRQRMTARRIPIVLFSANRDIARIAALAEVDGYLAKPFDVDQLLSKIDQSLTIHTKATVRSIQTKANFNRTSAL